MSNSVVVLIIIFLFLIGITCVYANDKRLPKTPQEIAVLGARAVPIIYTSYDFKGERVEVNGSGFFINDIGQVITCAHVVRQEPDTWCGGPRAPWLDKHPVLGADYKYQVALPWCNKIFEARLLGFNKYKDLAKLQVIGINSKDYDILPFGKAVELVQGDEIFCLGSSSDFACSIIKGIVSGLHRDTNLNYIEDTIQIDVKVEGGNSGGVAVNAYGEIVGVVYGYEEQFSLAMPIEFVTSELNNGEVEMAYLGLDLETGAFMRDDGQGDLFKMQRFVGNDNEKVLSKILDLTRKNGVVVSEAVDERTLAAKVGLKRGDIISRINGRLIKNKMHFRILQSQANKNQPIVLEVKRVTLKDDGEAEVEYFNAKIITSCDK